MKTRLTITYNGVSLMGCIANIVLVKILSFSPADKQKWQAKAFKVFLSTSSIS